MIIYNGVNVVKCIQYIKLSTKGETKVILILDMLLKILTLKQNVDINNKIISIRSITQIRNQPI